MSKSPGQWIGTIAGGVIGSFFGMPALGASLGGMVGGMIDPPKGPSVTGPRLEDQSFTSSTLGAALARGYGTFPVSGNVIWLEGDKYREVTMTEEQGGKGGGGAETTTYSYYAAFAVSLLRVTDPTQTVSLRKLWVGSNLVYDAGSGNSDSIIASNSDEIVNFTFYGGSDTQQPNPRWQADKGVNAVSGLPGRCYIVIEDLDLAKYGNSLAMAQIKAEVVVGAASTASCYQAETVIVGITAYLNVTSCVFGTSGAEYVQVYSDGWTQLPENIDYCSLRLSDYHRISSSRDITADIGSFSTYAIYQVPAGASDRPVTILQLVPPLPFNNESRIWLYSNTGSWQSLAIPVATLDVAEHKFASVEGIETFIHQAVTAGKVHRFSGSVIAASSAGAYSARASGLSENYLFLVGYTLSGTTTTIYRLNRSDLSLNATWTGTAFPYNASIHVVDDETVYTAVGNGGATGGGHVYKWVSGTVVADLGEVVPETFSSDTTTLSGWFRVVNDAPPYVLSLSNYAGLNDAVWIGHVTIPASAASLREVVTAECGLAGIASADLDLAALTNESVRGYRITERGSVRAVLESLQARFPFDVAHSGYKLRFVSRGGASLATIPEGDLGTVAGSEKDAVLLTVAREMDTQLPRKVSVKYLDVDREYDMGEQYAERPAPNSVNERTLELPLVMNSSEGAKTADVLLSKDWVERVDFGPFSLPPTWSHLEAIDVVTIEHRGQSHTVRLTRAEYLPDGRITCNAKLTAAQSYTSTATGAAPAVTGQTLVPLRGSTSAYLLDIPRIVAEQDVPGMAFGLLGRASGWPGGMLLRSDDSGNTWQTVGAMSVCTRVFVASGALAAHHGYSIDHAAVLTVTPETPGAELFGVTESQLYAQSNLAAYGVDGRWEIVCFKTVADNTGTYTLKDFLRGLYGTEWATGLHAEGDLLVLLDTSTVGFFGLPTSDMGAERIYRAVTQGGVIDSASNETDTYEAHNLKPLSPVDFYADRGAASRDWSVGFKARTRWPVSLFSGTSVPLGETSEGYRARIWDSSFATIKREFSGLTSPSFDYTLAQQTADFGSQQETLYITAEQVSSVVGVGYEGRSTLTRILSDDPYISYVTALLHMNDTGLTDVCGKTVTLNGGVARSATQSKFGGYSAYFDGSGDYLSLASSSAFGFGTADFAVECWIYISGGQGTDRAILDFRAAPDAAATFFIDGATNKLAVWYGAKLGATGTVLTTYTWYHVALARKSGTLYCRLGGALDWSSTASLDFGASKPLGIGGAVYSGGGGSSPFNGYIDDVRITKGSARGYDVSFSVPTTQFPDP